MDALSARLVVVLGRDADVQGLLSGRGFGPVCGADVLVQLVHCHGDLQRLLHNVFLYNVVFFALVSVERNLWNPGFALTWSTGCRVELWSTYICTEPQVTYEACRTIWFEGEPVEPT